MVIPLEQRGLRPTVVMGMDVRRWDETPLPTQDGTASIAQPQLAFAYLLEIPAALLVAELASHFYGRPQSFPTRRRGSSCVARYILHTNFTEWKLHGRVL